MKTIRTMIWLALAVALSVPVSECRAQSCPDGASCPGMPGRPGRGAGQDSGMKPDAGRKKMPRIAGRKGSSGAGDQGSGLRMEPKATASRKGPQKRTSDLVGDHAGPDRETEQAGPDEPDDQSEAEDESASDEEAPPRSPRRPAIRPKAPAEPEEEEEDSEEAAAPRQAPSEPVKPAESSAGGAKTAARDIGAACANELGLLCGDSKDDPRASLKCLRANRRALTSGCQDALSPSR